MYSDDIKKYLASKEETVVEAMKKIDANSKGILFIVNESEKLCGVVTDGDIRRWIIHTGNLNGTISEIMNPNPKYILKKDINDAGTLMKQYYITAIPVVMDDSVIEDIIFNDTLVEDNIKFKKKSLQTIPVVIMAGGKGTRLYPYTKILPKPLIPIGDIPIMERIINAFTEYGVEEFYATVNYKKEMIKSYFSEAGTDYKINYIEEDQPLGTAGSIKLMKKKFEKPFVLTNCDILIRADYDDIYRHHIKMENELTIVTALKNVVIPYGVIYSSENGRIDSMQEKPRLSYFVNTGMYILNDNLVDDIPENEVFHMTDLTEKLLSEGRRVGMYPISEDSFLDMGEMEEMHRMEQKLNLNAD